MKDRVKKKKSDPLVKFFAADKISFERTPKEPSEQGTQIFKSERKALKYALTS
jgi:hypothetical protein